MQKNYFLYLLFTLFYSALFAQAWQPISLHQKYNYRQTNDLRRYITHVLWVDSTKVENGDSVFYTNRFIKPCKSCTDTLSRIYDQPLFLQRKIIKKANGVFIFQDTQTLVLQSLANLGDSWTFDTLHNVEAQVTQVYTQTIFSVLDSVKKITLSNGKIFHLSKNLGILDFQEYWLNTKPYYLVGIENPVLGLQIPTQEQFYQYEIGDRINYSTTYAGSGEYSEWCDTYIILDKSILGNQLIYNIAQTSHLYKWMGMTMSTACCDTFLLNINIGSKTYPNMIVADTTPFLHIPYYSVSYLLDTGGIKCHFNGNENIYRTGYISPHTAYPSYPSNGLPSPYPYLYYDSNIQTYSGEICKIKYGEISTINGYWEGSGNTTQYFAAANDSITPFPHCWSTPITDKTLPHFSIYPNPAQELLIIENKNATLMQYEAHILDVTGREVFTENFSAQKYIIELKNLDKGIYMLRLQAKEGEVFYQKFVKE